eukprot:1145207-Pelagomonas_calceolata.AAC.6
MQWLLTGKPPLSLKVSAVLCAVSWTRKETLAPAAFKGRCCPEDIQASTPYPPSSSLAVGPSTPPTLLVICPVRILTGSPRICCGGGFG